LLTCHNIITNPPDNPLSPSVVAGLSGIPSYWDPRDSPLVVIMTLRRTGDSKDDCG